MSHIHLHRHSCHPGLRSSPKSLPTYGAFLWASSWTVVKSSVLASGNKSLHPPIGWGPNRPVSALAHKTEGVNDVDGRCHRPNDVTGFGSHKKRGTRTSQPES
ncbi:hypothetical protein DPEC_G00203930 [Dallia pectoralis]|uniref:Uncharacterized protein n=1 Tax=Dallia pectoralis TaxID=75939 RepID=A0ACC2G9V5_DALPE|nr:hypothetical protein DPEC_G00203930 [Dallia pectoralis]